MELDFKQLAQAIVVISEEKSLPEDVVKNIVEQALAAAYRRDYGDREQEVTMNVNLNTGKLSATITKTVVDSVKNEHTEISLAGAKKLQADIKLGDSLAVSADISGFGRVAAQTAKQVILQRLREAEKEIFLNEYHDKIGTIVNATVVRIIGSLVRVDLGKAQAIMPRSEQIQGERLYPGQRLKVYIKEVDKSLKGSQVVVSRANEEFIKLLFKNEVPEMESGAVDIKLVAREAGVRSKIAVVSNVPGVDPVGTFVGGRGTRVNAVMSEIGEQEKIDIIIYSDNDLEFIKNSLSPTEIETIKLDQAEKRAKVYVDDKQLSVAIGRNGQNVRLASKLTGYELDIEPLKNLIQELAQEEPQKANSKEDTPAQTASSKPKKIKNKAEIEESLISAIEEKN